VPPSRLAESVQVLQDVHSQSVSITQKLRNTTPYLQGRQRLCNCWARTRRSVDRGRWYSVFREDTFQHYPNCPRSKTADYSRSVAAQFMICSRIVSVCVQAGWQCSRRGGWNSIAPMLRYRAVVSSDSGAFKILKDAKITLRTLDNDNWDERHSNVLISAITTIQQTLGTNASPDDIDQYGNGLFHVCISFGLLIFMLNQIVCDALDVHI
jgi:hypothetical protein